LDASARRGTAAIWDHWLFLVALTAAAALRVAAWFAIHPAWWILGDSIGYIRVALTHVPETWRPGGYAAMVLLPLLPFHHLALVTAVQHLMGLAAGALVYATLTRLGVPRWAAVFAAAPVLFDGYVIATEQMLASEALFGFLVAGGLAVLLWKADGPGYLAVVAGGLLLGLSVTTRIVGLPLIAVAVLALLVRRAGWSRVVALCIAFLLPLGAYSLWFDRYHGQFNLTASSGVFLYGRTTNFVDCNRVHFTSEQLRSICPAEPVGARDEVALVFAYGTPLSNAHLGEVGTNSLAQQFAIEAILAQPGDYAALVRDGLVRSFAWDQSNQPMDMQFNQNEATSGEVRYISYLYQDGRGAGPTYRPGLVHALAAYQPIFTVRGPMVLFALLLALAGLLFGRDPDGRKLRSATILTAGTAAVLVLVPAATAIVAPRYRVPADPALGLAAVLGATLLFNRWRAARRVEHAPAVDLVRPAAHES
jgi:hypothetical protein